MGAACSPNAYQVAEKRQGPLANARGSELCAGACRDLPGRDLPSRDREGAVWWTFFFATASHSNAAQSEKLARLV